MQSILSGVITDVFEVEKYGDFRKRVIWLQEIKEKHPQHWALEFWHDEAELLPSFVKNGQAVTCHLSIKGKKVSKYGKEFIIVTLKIDKILKF